MESMSCIYVGHIQESEPRITNCHLFENWNLKYDMPFCVLIFSLVFEAIIRLVLNGERSFFYILEGGAR